MNDRMYPLTLAGLDTAIKTLLKAPKPTIPVAELDTEES